MNKDVDVFLEAESRVAGWWPGASGGIEGCSEKEFVFRLSPQGLAANFSSEKLSVQSLAE